MTTGILWKIPGAKQHNTNKQTKKHDGNDISDIDPQPSKSVARHYSIAANGTFTCGGCAVPRVAKQFLKGFLQ